MDYSGIDLHSNDGVVSVIARRALRRRVAATRGASGTCDFGLQRAAQSTRTTRIVGVTWVSSSALRTSWKEDRTRPGALALVRLREGRLDEQT